MFRISDRAEENMDLAAVTTTIIIGIATTGDAHILIIITIETLTTLDTATFHASSPQIYYNFVLSFDNGAVIVSCNL